MNASELERFVAAAAAAQGLSPDPEQLRRIAAVFLRNADIARAVLDFELADAMDPAPVFTP